MPCVYQNSVEVTNHKAPKKALRSILELHPPIDGSPAHIEAADTPHADTASGPLSGTLLLVMMIALHHHPYQS